MSTYIDRVKQEKKDLVDKLSKLEDFIYGDKFDSLESNVKELLFRQRSAMKEYLEVLTERLAL